MCQDFSAVWFFFSPWRQKVFLCGYSHRFTIFLHSSSEVIKVMEWQAKWRSRVVLFKVVMTDILPVGLKGPTIRNWSCSFIPFSISTKWSTGDNANIFSCSNICKSFKFYYIYSCGMWALHNQCLSHYCDLVSSVISGFWWKTKMQTTV